MALSGLFEGLERQAVLNLVAACCMVFAADMALGLTYPLLSVLLEMRGFDERAIGINASMAPIGVIIAGFVLPAMVKRLGARTVVIGALTLIALMLAGLMVTPNYYLWCLFRLFMGFGVCSLYTVSEAWIMIYTPDDRRGRMTSLYMTIMAIGFGLGPFILPFTGITGPMPFVIAIICVLVAGLSVSFVRETSDSGGDHHSGASPGILRFALIAPVLLAAVLSLTTFESILLAFFPIYGLRTGLDITTTSWLLGTAAIGYAIMQYPIGLLADRWSRMGIVWVCTIITIALTALMPQVIDSIWIWPLVFVLGISVYSVYTMALVILGDNFKGPMLIAGSAAIGSMWGVGGVAGPPAAGAAIAAFGVETFPYLLTSIYVLFFGFLIVTGGQMVRRQQVKA